MPSTVYTGLGATLKRLTVEIAYLTDIGGVSLKQAAINITNMQSPSDAEEYLGGLISVGSVSLKGWFKPGDSTGQIALKTDLLGHTLQSFTVTYDAAAASAWTFDALVEEFTISGVTIDNAIEFSASLKVSGIATLGLTASGGITALSGIDNAVGDLTLVPVFGVGTYLYEVSVVTGVDHIHLTVTAAAHTISLTVLGVTHVLATTVQSEPLILGVADTVTTIVITVTETGKVAKVTTIYVARAHA